MLHTGYITLLVAGLSDGVVFLEKRLTAYWSWNLQYRLNTILGDMNMQVDLKLACMIAEDWISCILCNNY